MVLGVGCRTSHKAAIRKYGPVVKLCLQEKS
jgi:hypothetical protein